MDALKETHFQFPGQTGFYRGKVRDVYHFPRHLVVIASDRISAFDVVLPRAIPYKGQVLNQIAAQALRDTADLVPNWLEASPHPSVSIGKKCEPFKVEMVIRGYLAGHAWRTYRAGGRTLCGEPLPEGLRENDPLPHPIITPTTKASQGHDEDISGADLLTQGIVDPTDYTLLKKYTFQLFERGSQLAAQRGLILVDTKYEFGKLDGQVYLIDEIHTPDSSRYFYADGYAERQDRGEVQRQLSKEFVREWLIANGFQGHAGQSVPLMSDLKVAEITDRYVELYERLTGNQFFRGDYATILTDIEQQVRTYLPK